MPDSTSFTSESETSAAGTYLSFLAIPVAEQPSLACAACFTAMKRQRLSHGVENGNSWTKIELAIPFHRPWL